MLIPGELQLEPLRGYGQALPTPIPRCPLVRAPAFGEGGYCHLCVFSVISGVVGSGQHCGQLGRCVLLTLAMGPGQVQPSGPFWETFPAMRVIGSLWLLLFSLLWSFPNYVFPVKLPSRRTSCFV